MGKVKYYIVFLVVIFGLLIFLGGGEKKPVDWRPTYSVYDKIPLGLYVLNQEIDELLDEKVERFSRTPYEFLDSVWDYDNNSYKITGNMMAISANGDLDSESLNEIFYFVGHGNTAFLSMEDFPKMFRDSLKIQTRTGFDPIDTLRVKLSNKKLGNKSYGLHEGTNPVYFSSIDTLNSKVLGVLEGDSLKVNFVKVKYKNGNFLLHSSPAAFTNFHLLKGNHHEYAQKVLSYLPQDKTYWYVSKNANAISNSKLRYISQQPALQWAWYLLIFGIVAFMIFNGRRKQRVVPILDPLPNTTVEFAKTIGNLYYQEGAHHTVINRKIVYFLEKVRNEYHIDTSKLDEAFMEKLHQKSGKPLADIEQAIFLINHHRRSPHMAVEEDLIKINSALEKIS